MKVSFYSYPYTLGGFEQKMDEPAIKRLQSPIPIVTSSSLRDKNGQKKEIYFDITAFFNNWGKENK